MRPARAWQRGAHAGRARLGSAPAWGALGLAMLGLAVGCGSDERYSAAGSAAAGAGAQGGAAGSGGSAGAGAAGGAAGSGGSGGVSVRRTVHRVSPYGRLRAPDNLLWDGDFEWHSPLTAQYGWVRPSLFGRYQPTNIDNVRVGPSCLSGLKCAELGRGASILGLGVAPTGAPVEASVWSKPASGDCAEVTVSLIGCFDVRDGDLTIPPPEAPDASGWCEYAARLPERSYATCLLIHSGHHGPTPTLVDDAVIRAATGSALRRGAAQPVSPELARQLPALRRGLAEALAPGAGVRSQDGEALTRWLTRSRPQAGSGGRP